MKRILLIVIMMSGVKCYAQTTLDTVFKITVLESSTIIRYGYIKYVDTLPEWYSFEGALTLGEKKGGGSGTFNDPDTMIYYNHFAFIEEKVRGEVEYWDRASKAAWNKYDKTQFAKHYIEYQTCIRRLEYWAGVRDGIQFVLHRYYRDPRFSYDMKTYKATNYSK